MIFWENFETITKNLYQESFYNEEIIYLYQTPSRALLSNWDNTIMNWIFISSEKLSRQGEIRAGLETTPRVVSGSSVITIFFGTTSLYFQRKNIFQNFL